MAEFRVQRGGVFSAELASAGDIAGNVAQIAADLRNWIVYGSWVSVRPPSGGSSPGSDQPSAPNRESASSPSALVPPERDIASGCVDFVPGTYGSKVPIFNSCDHCMTMIVLWSNALTWYYDVAPHSTRWIDVESFSGQKVGERKCLRESKETEVNQRVDPPEEIRELVEYLFNAQRHEGTIKAADIPSLILAVLNQFLQRETGKDECKVISIDGCNSCCNSGMAANLVNTTCGLQCWTCHDECH